MINRKCEVILGSYGYAYDYLKSKNLCKVVKVPREWRMVGNSGKFDVKKTFLSTLKIILTKYRSIIGKEKKNNEKKQDFLCHK